jgi:3-oxoacyl-[acyl-carrier protein] reductase
MIPVPTYPAGRDLLRDKVVVVTAAAGTGIGSAVAKRSLEEGASSSATDTNGDSRRRRPSSVKCTR